MCKNIAIPNAVRTLFSHFLLPSPRKIMSKKTKLLNVKPSQGKANRYPSEPKRTKPGRLKSLTICFASTFLPFSLIVSFNTTNLTTTASHSTHVNDPTMAGQKMATLGASIVCNKKASPNNNVRIGMTASPQLIRILVMISS